MTFPRFIALILLWGLSFTTAAGTERQSLSQTIESYFQQHNPPLHYRTRHLNGWELRFEPNQSHTDIVLWVRVAADSAGNQFIAFWSVIETIPPEIKSDPHRLNALYKALLDIGRDYYIVKAIVDPEDEIGIQAEIHAGGMTAEQFYKTLWMVVDLTDQEADRLREYVKRAE
ncbi:MAG: hypothetical protein D6675_16180 [Gemmatimonadetes bacterium]|nr:MAG: hypothetical protein D6675_16180 [Gemmatimonadota bacterium]